MLPLVKKDGQPELAREVFRELRERVQAEYDEGGAIGRRYRRQDEIGTPWAVTIDHQSLEDRTVTVRDRDSLAQDRGPDRRARRRELERRLRAAVALAEARRLATLSRHQPVKLHRRRMTASIAADQISYDDLYARWEQGNWRATEIDLSIDREQWQHEFNDLERRAALWTYSMFFHGEDSVADNLSPYIDAAPTRGAEVLPRHPAGRRGTTRGPVRAVHAGGRRRGRATRPRSRRDPAAADLGLPEGLRPA